MFLLYDLFFILFGLIYLPYAIIKGKVTLDGLLMRMGIFSKKLIEGSAAKSVIWIHSVSVGEVMAIKVLVDSIRKRFPDHSLVISTITKTGNYLAKKIFLPDVSIIYLPFDISFIVRHVLDYIRPELFILCETELWPNMISALYKRRIPILLINGRVSDGSFRGYRLVKPILLSVLRKIDSFCMQTEQYASRMNLLGASDKKIKVTGNMKFDIKILEDVELTNRMQRYINETERLFIAGSTHPGEEIIILKVYNRLLNSHKKLRLLIAPRHIERISEIERLIKMAGFDSIRISARYLPNSPSADIPTLRLPSILLLDTVGELASLYQVATIVFMGGSLVKKGGHNPIEPAIYGRPILFGPYVHNFKDIYDLFLKNEAAICVHNGQELFDGAKRLLESSHTRTSIGFCAKRLVDVNRGATERNLEVIREFLEDKLH